MKGYKAFDKDLQCRGMQYEIGGTYELGDTPVCCKKGFHFCRKISDCYRFYDMTDYTRICEVEALGEVVTDDCVKYCTNKIHIIREVENPGVKSNANETSTGYCNSGNYNTGNYNSGHCNTGDHNSGNYNNGDWNSGNWNSGDNNTGNRNSGDWNSGYYNSGVFNTEKIPTIKMFDKDSNWTINDWYRSTAYRIMDECQVKAVDKQKWWDNLPDNYKQAVMSLPNFDADKFYQCTGIRVET